MDFGAIGAGLRAGWRAGPYGVKAVKFANDIFTYLGHDGKQKKKNMSSGTDIGPQDNAGGARGAGGGLLSKTTGTNPSDCFLRTSYTGVGSHALVFASNIESDKGIINFRPTGTATSWNNMLLNPIMAALDVYNYYQIESVEFVFLLNAIWVSTSDDWRPGPAIFKICPWTAEFNVGNSMPTTDISLLEDCETVWCRIQESSSNQYQPRSEDLQRGLYFIVHPQYQQNSNSAVPGDMGPNVKAQYSRAPLQIASAEGVDDTVWYGFIFQIDTTRAVPGGQVPTIRVPYYYKVNINLSGRRWAILPSSLINRESYFLGYDDMGKHYKSTSRFKTSGIYREDENDDIFRYSPINSSKKIMSNSPTPTLVIEDDSDKKKSVSIGATNTSLDREISDITRKNFGRMYSDVHKLYKSERREMESTGYPFDQRNKRFKKEDRNNLPINT